MKTVWRVTNFLLSICDNFETGEIGLFIKVLLLIFLFILDRPLWSSFLLPFISLFFSETPPFALQLVKQLVHYISSCNSRVPFHLQ